MLMWRLLVNLFKERFVMVLMWFRSSSCALGRVKFGAEMCERNKFVIGKTKGQNVAKSRSVLKRTIHRFVVLCPKDSPCDYTLDRVDFVLCGLVTFARVRCTITSHRFYLADMGDFGI